MFRPVKGLSIFTCILLYLSCANRLNPTGGPRDEVPPDVVAEASTKNFSTHFTDRHIILTFNEWVELDDPINQILVSPPLEQRPEIRLKGKAVTFTFHDDETLKAEATYTINFGEAIKDLTEGNSLENFSFVFSTGAFIDSLVLSGHVVDAFTGDPVENATIMLYDNLADSAVYQEKPFYASRSRKDGSFRIQNVKADTFNLITVGDENLNYQYDPASERIGFLSSHIIPKPDTIEDLIVQLSAPLDELFLDRLDTTAWNAGVLTYSRIPFDIEIATQTSLDSIYWERRDRTIDFWYLPNSLGRHIIYLSNLELAEVDTVSLRTDSQEQPDMIVKQSRKTNSGHPQDPFFLCFSRPIQNVDSSKIQLQTASGVTHLAASYSIDSLKTCLMVTYSWQQDSSYLITLLPGALTALNGVTNDTIRENFPIGGEDRFGNIVLRATGFSTEMNYIIELIQNNKVERTFYLQNQSEVERTLGKLRPATFSLQITEDRNANRRWDPADYLEKRQAEKVVRQVLEPLRANWDVEVIFEWK